MEYAAKDNKNNSETVENSSDIAEPKHSLAKDKIGTILRGGDQEAAAKQAASEAVFSNSDSSSIPSNKQPIAQRSHIRSILTDASPTTIPNKTRSDIENKYNADFSSVRFYEDAKSTKAVNAKAYTYGSDVVLSPKYYQSNTIEGNKLIAHELSHVVQQNNSGTMQLQRDEAPKEIPADQLADYNDSLNEIMPGVEYDEKGKLKKYGTGLLHNIYIVGILVDTFEDDKKIGALTRAIAVNKDAKAITKSHGICGLMALYDANVDAKKALKLLEQNKEFYSLDAIVKRSKQNPVAGIKKDLLKVSSDSEQSAKSEGAYSNISRNSINANWALALSKDNLTNLKDSVSELKMVQVHSDNAQARFKSSKASLTEAEDKMDECKKSYKTARSKGGGDASAMYMVKKIVAILAQAKDSLSLASAYGIKHLDRQRDSIESEMEKLGPIFTAWKQHRDSQKGKYSRHRTIYDLGASGFDEIKGKIAKINRKFREDNYKYQGSEKSVQRIEYIIRYFIMLNDKTYKNGPTIEESKGYLNTLDELSDDFEKVFGGILAFNNSIYLELIDIIPKQVKARILIEKQSGKDPGIKINRSSIETHFKSIKKQSNEAVKDAYAAYAGGFFQHRIEAPKERENPPTVDEIFANPITIGGARLVVCAGYAELGMHLLELAGGTPKGFITWGELTEAEVLDEDAALSSLHIVAKVRRKNKNIYISNDEVYDSEEAAFQSVGFEKVPTNGKISVKSKGKTAKSSGKNFIKQLERKRKQL